jgi:hypothetical protein
VNYTFFINYNSTVTQVYPLNWLECSLIDEQEKDQVFYRRKFQGALTFGSGRIEITVESGVNVVSHICEDYDLFNTIRLADPCARIDLLILSGTDVYYEAYFSISEGEWDFDNKLFVITPLPTDDYSNWAEDGDLEFNILSVAPTVTVNCNGYSYTRNRWLLDVIEYLALQVFPACTVSSNIFTQTTDYVTLTQSKLLYLTIAAKSDIKRPTSSDPATVANMSFNEMMFILKMFNIYWTYSETFNILTVEHISYFGHTSGMDLRTQKIAIASNKYRYDKESMPKYEKFHFMEAKSADFIGDAIWYDSLCVDQNSQANIVEYYNRVTTEVELLQDLETVDSISDDGFVILANYKSGVNYYTYSFGGIRDTVVRWNMSLSWSYLFQCYHRHNRVLLAGYMNFVATTFVSAKKTIIQEVNAIVCSDYTPEEYITTELGETYLGGLKGYVKRAVIKPYGEINFTLGYGPVDNVNSGIPVTAKALTVIQSGLDVWSYLSEPNIYNTYYSVLTNLGLGDVACDVIMIPAGTTYQYDMLSQINPLVTVAYNFTDTSLTGWAKTVNSETTYLTCVDAECDTGAPAPPAVPAVPVITGHTQATTCGPVRINWSAVAGATYYVLQRNPDLGGNAAWQTQYTGVGLYYDDYDAGGQEITFLYRLSACNITGCSAYCADYTVNDIMC